jgi:hypothetical protein
MGLEIYIEASMMVRYCNRCGKDNLDDAAYCINCGAPLTVTSGRRARRERRRDEEWFIVPRGGSIAGIVFGLFLIFIGVALYAGWSFSWTLVGAAFLLLLGVLVVIAALYMRRR